ncbi:hypothetical protein LCGC14_1144650 [marine sediment metagenome]|uniref:Uncharacterized protein n=1 Tax=marine sediment metagenome TaxID=412755 RepID=A0A0F9PFC9_9ZZZZ
MQMMAGPLGWTTIRVPNPGYPQGVPEGLPCEALLMIDPEFPDQITIRLRAPWERPIVYAFAGSVVLAAVAGFFIGRNT